MSKRIIESMRNFKYFKKLRKTRKEPRSHFFARYFLSKTPEKLVHKNHNVNFIFKFIDYKSLDFETSEDIFIKELKKSTNEESELKHILNTFYSEKDNNKRNINIMMNIINRNKNCRKYFKYNEINEDLIKKLLTYSYHEFYKKDSVIFKTGSKQTAFYYIIRGKVSLKTMNNEMIRRNVYRNRYKLETIYNNIKDEEKFNLQNISEDNISLDNFISKTNLETIHPRENKSQAKTKMSPKNARSAKKFFLTSRSKTRIATLKLETSAKPTNIVQDKILIENFSKIQKDLSSTVKTYKQGDFLCDWELILDKPHTETAYAEEDTDLLIFQKKYFDKYFSNHFIKTDNERKLFLTKRIEFLHINNVINLKPEFYDRGDVIYTQFDTANEFFVLYKGKGALMELNDNYVYKKKRDIIFNSLDLKKICYVDEGCVVGLESFNDGTTKYEHNFVIDEDNTVIYRIKMKNISMDNYLKKKNKMKLIKQLNEMYLDQNEMLPKLSNNKKLTQEEKKYKKKEEKLNDIFYEAKAYFWKKLMNEKRTNTVYGNLNQISEMNKYLSSKKNTRKTVKFSLKHLSTLKVDSTPSFKRQTKFHFLTTINKLNKKTPKDEVNILPFKNNLKNTLELLNSDKKNNENNNKDNNKKHIFEPKRFSMFAFNFKSNLFKEDKNNNSYKTKNKTIDTKNEETFFDFYGDTNNDFFKKTDSKFKQKKKITADLFDKYIVKTIKAKKDDINYNSGNFKIPLFGSKKSKK